MESINRMSNEAIAEEMFIDIDLTASVLPEQLSSLEAVAEGRSTGAADGLIKQVMYSDLIKDMLDVSIPEPAPFPTRAGAVPNKRPNTGSVSARRKKLEQILTQSGVTIENYPKETIQALLDSMESYIDGAVRISRKVG